MLQRLLPTTVVVVESFGEPARTPLFPEEEAVVARAVAKRRNEFAAVRCCARRGLTRLGIASGPILPGPKGAPTWPVGVVGSMTHCAGYSASAVARATDVVSVGIDAEPEAPLPRGLLNVIARPEEQAHLQELAGQRPDVCWDRLLFSMKESVYKAWFPLTRRWLDFEDAVVSLDPSTDRFEVRLLVPGAWVAGREVTTFTGRWRIEHGLVVTAAVHLPS